MKALRKLFDTTLKKVVALALVLLLLVWLVLFFVARNVAFGLVQPILWTLVLVTAAWVGIHFGVRAWRKRKRTEFDQKVAAKEGIEDRRREWNTWTAELEKQDIDRYELPFYLLVGEPQSGKSVLLQNSDLHFPFGQNRLSGVGGTRGCDWWFTEEAVILDLAGRLFTHEGGAADRLEFEAFLQLLYDFRPLCPVNGVILVIPCDSLARDNAEQCGAKATKIQNALLTLTTQLQAQLPVYLVLTKGDQIFGFAESVHRLDVERRHQMFGWSRGADKLDAPFDVAEALAGFDELVKRARLLRAHMTAGARLPEALPEVDRMYAFPDELQSLQPNLELYLKRVFTASNVTDRVFFRGLYLTSGLQTGVPIAKVCTDLFGQAGEADRRNLDALFSKQRAYFIKDLVQKRIFAERGLVRPTQGRVQQTRRSAVVGYGLAGAVVLASLVFAFVYLIAGTDQEKESIYASALKAGEGAAEASALPMPGLLFQLQQIADAAEHEPGAYEEAFTDARDDFEGLYCGLFDTRAVPLVHATTLDVLEAKLSAREGLADFAELRRVCDALLEVLGDVDFSSDGTREDVLACLGPVSSARTTDEGGQPLSLERAFELRLQYGGDDGLLVPLEKSPRERLVRLARLGVQAVEQCMEPGARAQPDRELGYMLAWMGAQQAHAALLDPSRLPSTRSIEPCVAFSRSMQALRRIEENELESGGGGKSVKNKDVLLQARRLNVYRDTLVDFLAKADAASAPGELWPRMNALVAFVGQAFVGREGPFNLSAIGAHFGSEDAGQTLFQETEATIGMLTGEIVIGVHVVPTKDLDDPPKLLEVCDNALPADLRDGRLIGLAQHIRRVDTDILATAVPLPVEVFVAQCLQLAGSFETQFPGADAARRAVSAEGGPLSVELVDELVALHRALGALIEKREIKGDKRERLTGWQAAIEGLLQQHLEQRGPASEWLPAITADGALDTKAWNILDAFAEAARLEGVAPQRHPLGSTAGEAFRGAFVEEANQLLALWDSRAPEQQEQTLETVKELGQLALDLSKRPGAKEALSGVDFEAWSSRVDSVLHDRLEGMNGEIREVWRANIELDLPLQSVVSAARGQLAGVAEKIQASERSGMAVIGLVLDELKDGGPIASWLALPRSREVLAELEQWKVPRRTAEVESDQEYQDLKRTLERLAALAAGEGQALAAEYRERFFGRTAQRPPASNAGIRLVREIEGLTARRVAAEVREQYLAELQDVLESNTFDDFFQMLFWEPGQDTTGYRDSDMQDALDKLLSRRKGEFAKLNERYKLAGDKGIGADIFPVEPRPDESEWAAVHRFLAALAEFLLADDEAQGNVRNAKLSFWLIPEVTASGSVWDLRGLPPDERRDAFYFPGDNSVEELQKKAMGTDIGRLKVSSWGFQVNRPDRSLLLLWSKQQTQSGARSDASAYRYEVPGCLAPLFLAWTGQPTDDESREEFQVPLDIERSERPAPLSIQFERPLPLRPAKP